ncbi:PIG-L family deacetylase [Candidatus Daviesbacteria bacterium]|nr:PIG-L family deacetylase [Candidatus Daviesbacteria bacterium]
MDLEVKDKTILCVGAHADDTDFGSSASVAKWVKMGATVYYLILTDGSKGSEDMSIPSKQLVKMRVKEQKEAAKVLGVKEVFFGGFKDGELVNSAEVRKIIVKLIRQQRPNIVLTIDPTFVYDERSGFINHPDHRAAGQATLDSIFPFARNSRTFPEFLDQGLPVHIVRDVLLTNFAKRNFYIDVTDTLEVKFRALEKHVSQLDDKEKLFNRVRERAEKIGQEAGFKYAEGFVHIHIGH